MQQVNGDFIGDFLVGDNIGTSLETLALLYDLQHRYKTESREVKLLRKPIIVWIAAITEAVLYDLTRKMQCYSVEGVPNVSKKTQKQVEGKTYDDFEKYIAVASSKKLLGNAPQIYAGLHRLRKLRNRVHIQNEVREFEDRDIEAFSQKRQQESERTLEFVITHVSKAYPRNSRKARGHVGPFFLPWPPHQVGSCDSTSSAG